MDTVGQTSGVSIHWGPLIADVVAVAALAAAIPSFVYARRADKRAEKAEQRIAAEEKRNAVRWQLELSHDPKKLWLRNVGTQDASQVSIVDPGAALAQLGEPANWIVSGHAIPVLMNDPGKTVTSLMVSWAQSDQGSVNVPLPPEWLTVPTPQPEFSVEVATGSLFRLRNMGAPARNVFAEPDGTGKAQGLPQGVDLATGQAHEFMVRRSVQSGVLSTLKVTWDGHPVPAYVPVP